MSLSVSTFVIRFFEFWSFVNSCPFALYPITYIPWFFPFESFCLVIIVESDAAFMCFASFIMFPSSSVIGVNTFLSVVVPSPCCPQLLYPVVYTVLSSFNAIVWYAPADISFISFISFPFASTICCGSMLCVKLFCPSCPLSFLPVAHILPFDSSIIRLLSPPEICIMFDIFCIFTGYGLVSLVVLFPNSP